MGKFANSCQRNLCSDNLLPSMRRVLLQVTAYQVITANGQLGDFPTDVQFAIVNPSDQAVSFYCSAFEMCGEPQKMKHQVVASHTVMGAVRLSFPDRTLRITCSAAHSSRRNIHHASTSDPDEWFNRFPHCCSNSCAA